MPELPFQHSRKHGALGEGTALCPMTGATMNKQIFLLFLLSGLFSLSPAFAQEQEDNFSGEISAQGTLAHINGSKAKFNEYGDIQNGLYGDIKIKYDDNKYYVDFDSRNLFYDTQSYDLEGGKWGAFKFNIDYNEIPHNFTYDARTLYSGAGTNNLTYTPNPPSAYLPNTGIGTWNTFDYSTKRKNLGAGFKLDVFKPFFLDFSAAVDEHPAGFPWSFRRRLITKQTASICLPDMSAILYLFLWAIFTVTSPIPTRALISAIPLQSIQRR